MTISREKSSLFPLTRWSLVKSSKENDGAALEELCRLYWQPLFLFVRGSGMSVEDAEDITQRFFHDLAKDSDSILGKPSQEDGRLRTWFRRILQHRISDHRRRMTRLKRGGGNVTSLDECEQEASLQLASKAEEPSAAFDRQWALNVLHLTLGRLKKDFVAANRENHFDVLVPFLGLGEENSSYAQLQETLKLTDSAARQTVHRFRERFRRHLREEIAETLENPNETSIDLELEELKASLAG